MTYFYAFNGDADGLCALQQLRLADPCSATLITGVKRDVQLLQRVEATAGDHITVLDISHDSNRDDLLALLDAGASVRYFDHHYAGPVPSHPLLALHIDQAADVCTSILVDRYCKARYQPWAIVGAFGDSLPKVGVAMAAALGIDAPTTDLLRHLGTYLNYNAYGETIDDLHFDPMLLAEAMLPFEDPAAFVRHSSIYAQLAEGYERDMALIRRVEPMRQAQEATLIMLPHTAWAKRAVGVFANEWMRANTDSALAILAPKRCGNFIVSVRVPSHSAVDASAFCRDFETGGGRKLAAGINHLPHTEVDRFAAAFDACFRTQAAGSAMRQLKA
jgi:nanoRNase/pAp phosphatase (c-di-AMP/oligoRNAs hydrolase)